MGSTDGTGPARIIDDAGRELIGYTDRWSAAAGETIRLMVSTTEPRFTATLVRLRHGDPSAAGPGFRSTPLPSAIDGAYEGHAQRITSGSYAVLHAAPALRTLAIWVWPTRPAAGREQSIVSTATARLLIDAAGRPVLRIADVVVEGAEPLEPERWVQLAVVAGPDRVALAIDGQAVTVVSGAEAIAGTIHLAASADGRDTFDGRLEALAGYARALDAGELAPSRLAALPPEAQWDIRAARLVNAPTAAVTGRRWGDDTTDFRSAPDEYAAVHFHSDDLDDAGWEPSLELTIPTDLRSGVYAFALEAGGLTDHVPFVVRPRPAGPTARIGLLLPTLTYQVYGNERMVDGGEAGMLPLTGS